MTNRNNETPKVDLQYLNMREVPGLSHIPLETLSLCKGVMHYERYSLALCQIDRPDRCLLLHASVGRRYMSTLMCWDGCKDFESTFPWDGWFEDGETCTKHADAFLPTRCLSATPTHPTLIRRRFERKPARVHLRHDLKGAPPALGSPPSPRNSLLAGARQAS